MSEIKEVKGREVLDSRGDPTIEVDIELASGARGRATTPSGQSNGVHQAVERRDHDMSRFGGKGVLDAVASIDGEIRDALLGVPADTQIEIDQILIALDGTPDKSRLGANAVLGASLAVAKSFAAEIDLPFYRYVGGIIRRTMPVPMINVLNGGSHADNDLDFQEFMILPVGVESVAEGLRVGAEIFHALGEQLSDTGHYLGLGDQGGYSPRLRTTEEALDFLMRGIESAGYRPGEDAVLAIDCAASAFFDDGEYRLKGQSQRFDSDGMIRFFDDLSRRYPIFAIEDGLAENDWDGWRNLTQELGHRLQLIGDDLFVTNPERLARGMEGRAANAILLKANQIGTLSETLEVADMARKAGFGTIMSHRSGETEDPAISDLAVAIGCTQIKAGSLSRSERLAKYNQLIRIEEDLATMALYAAPTPDTFRAAAGLRKNSSSQPDSGSGSPSRPFDAVIFDMDGVITDTASAHAASWKRLFDEYLEDRGNETGEEFREFDAEEDYRTYVDGKPRYDGVKSFLDSRDISLPFGDPEDPPEKETVCGLGNRKNAYFHEWIETNGVETYPSSIRLIETLTQAGIGVGLFTSSRNSKTVLKNAGIADLFKEIVDGNDLATLDIPGKPDPAMLRETARRLDTPEARTVVVEDAISGVEAGAAGGFGLVIGIARSASDEALSSHGANLVVRDLAELDFDPAGGFRPKSLAGLRPFWVHEKEFRDQLAAKELAVFLDYDGTLSPIVEDFTKAFISDEMRDAVDQLAQQCAVGVISGRDLKNLKDLVDLDSVVYAGSHGFDIEAPGQIKETLQKGKEFLPDLDAAESELKERLKPIAGHGFERQRFAIAVHYRQVAESDVAEVERIVDEAIENHPRLRKGHGKKVFQVQPRTDWHKGRAVRWLLQRLNLDRDDVLPLYVGDDITDEDAFRSLSGRGMCIAVGGEDRRTAADYRLDDPDDVRRFIDFLTDLVKARNQGA